MRRDSARLTCECMGSGGVLCDCVGCVGKAGVVVLVLVTCMVELVIWMGGSFVSGVYVSARAVCAYSECVSVCAMLA